MRRTLLWLVLVVVSSAAALGFARPTQVPQTAPSAPSPLPSSVATPPPSVPPTAQLNGIRPAMRVETPLSQFEPLSAFPVLTQEAVRSVLLGGNWLVRVHQSQGRFQFGYLPALRQPMDGDHDLKQALATLALAQSARFTGDDRTAVTASQAILTLLAGTKVDPADANVRVPIVSSLTCNRVGFSAVLALCIYELPGADAKLIGEAERLCRFIQRQLRSDGSVHYTDDPADVPLQVDPAGINEYPGYALHALAISNRVQPASWKVEAVQNGMTSYRTWFKSHPHPMLAATLTPGLVELYLQTKSAELAATVFELNDWLAGMQYQATDHRHPSWAGGFRVWALDRAVDAAPGFECGAYLLSLVAACELTRLVPDAARYGRYQQAAAEAVQYLCGLQYQEANTRHFENTFRLNTLIGGFHLSPTDGNLRIDATSWCVSGMLRFLKGEAERK